MILKSLTVGMFATNCYLVGCPQTGEGAVIDPGFEGKRIVAEIKRQQLNIVYIINTHGHVDHIGANDVVKRATGAAILLHEQDWPLYRNPGFGLALLAGKQPAPDGFVRDGEVIKIGRLSLQVLETPGHTPGSISLLCADKVFTGDALFAGSVGRTDLAGGSFDALIAGIKSKLLVLPAATQVLPGHGPLTSIGEERRSNPFLAV